MALEEVDSIIVVTLKDIGLYVAFCKLLEFYVMYMIGPP